MTEPSPAEELPVTGGPDCLDELRWRGLLAETTDEPALRAALTAGALTFYVGFDPTAPSLHIGHLVQILTARRLQQAGHRPLALVGGATGLIGDPKASGERTLNSPEVVAGWVGRLRDQIAPFLDFGGDTPSAALAVNNLDWTASLSAIELLRDVGRHFSVNRMLARDAVATRLAGGGISYTEFSYVLLQSNDFLELYRRHDCRLQLGGSDQWGNITAGAELVRRVTGDKVHALATPLLTRSDGQKFGKTEAGTVWLDPELTSAYAFFQFWLNVDDRDVGRYARVMSFRSPAELAAEEIQTQERPAARVAQRALAHELTALVHGERTADAVRDAGTALFGRGDLAALDAETLRAATAELPSVPWSGEPQPVVDVLAATGLVSSRSAARRAVQEGGAYVNNVAVTDVDRLVTADDLLPGGVVVLRRGRRTLAAVRSEGAI